MGMSAHRWGWIRPWGNSSQTLRMVEVGSTSGSFCPKLHSSRDNQGRVHRITSRWVFDYLQGRRSSNLLWAAGASDLSLSVPTSKSQSPKGASRNSYLLTKVASLALVAASSWTFLPSLSRAERPWQHVRLAAETNILLLSLCWWCSLHFSRRPLGCRTCKGKEWIGTHVQQLKCCPELSVKITADITGAVQADIFGEWLKEDGYF